MKNKNCLICNKEFLVSNFRLAKGHGRFCSFKCKGTWQSGIYKGSANPFYKGGHKDKPCITCGKLFLVKAYLIKSGRKKFCSVECRRIAVCIRNTGENSSSWRGGKPTCMDCGVLLASYQSKYCKFHALRGERHPFWNGKTDSRAESHRLRGRKDYVLWRSAVFMRDDYTCQTCGIRGGDLEADHIKPFSLYPELRLAIDNGRTLCVPCHKQTDTWGAKIHVLQNEDKK